MIFVSKFCPVLSCPVQMWTDVLVAGGGPQVSGKRTMVLSNEAKREMARKARALKEERKAALDGRHRYLISRLADSGPLPEHEAEEVLISDDKVKLESVSWKKR